MLRLCKPGRKFRRARTNRSIAHANAAGDTRESVRGIGRMALVTHQNMRDLPGSSIDPVVERGSLAAGQSKDIFHAIVDEHLGQHITCVHADLFSNSQPRIHESSYTNFEICCWIHYDS